MSSGSFIQHDLQQTAIKTNFDMLKNFRYEPEKRVSYLEFDVTQEVASKHQSTTRLNLALSIEKEQEQYKFTLFASLMNLTRV